MSQEPAEPAVADELPVNLYAVVAVGSLLALTMALLEKRMGLASFLPACFGLFGLLTQWRIAPFLVLAAVMLTLPFRAAGFVPTSLGVAGEFLGELAQGGLSRAQRIEPIPDFLACAALLSYVAAHFRLAGIQKNLFPGDRRKASPAGQGPSVTTTEKRSAHLIQPPEVILFLAGVPIWTGLAAVALFFLVRASDRLAWFPLPLRAPLLLLWVTGILLGALAAVLGYKSFTEAEPDENRQFLQDQLWRETRRDQTRLNRWLAWARLRAQRRIERDTT